MAVVACPFCKSALQVSGGSDGISACRCGAKYLVEPGYIDARQERAPELGTGGRERSISVVEQDGTPYNVTFF